MGVVPVGERISLPPNCGGRRETDGRERTAKRGLQKQRVQKTFFLRTGFMAFEA
jgi:hypothetical protein